jgi:hypothetical protein
MTTEAKPPEPVEQKSPWLSEETNPWRAVAPPCPHCDNPDTWLYHPSGTLRWYCYVCKRRFDPPKPKTSEATKKLREREAQKFPGVAKFGKLAD